MASELAFMLGVALGFAVPMLACLSGVLRSAKPLSASFDAGAGSLVLSARLAAAAVVLGSLAALARIVFWPDRPARAFNAAALLLLAIPGGFLAAALLTLQVKTQAAAVVNPSLAWLALGFALRFLFVPLLLAEGAIASQDPALLENAAALGQAPLARAFSVTVPLALGHLAAAAALVFTLAMGEVAIAATLAPPGAVPATIWLFNQQHMGYDESVFALSALLGGVTAATVALGAWAASRR
jgi:putative spermidine/putrescine transport system permease protein